MKLINENTAEKLLNNDFRKMFTHINKKNEKGYYFDDVFVQKEFLLEEARQHIEGQIYSFGTNLEEIYQASWVGYGNKELNILKADEQIPLIKELKLELDPLLEKLFNAKIKSHFYQIRELQPGYNGHPKHVDYKYGYKVQKNESGDNTILHSVSISLPISEWNGKTPKFFMYNKDGEIIQDNVRSVAFFGPKIEHMHPSEDTEDPFIWLITQCFFEEGLA
jgi:hypothetical protein